jgi:hypothetical protein
MNKFLVLEGRNFLDTQATEGLVQQHLPKSGGSVVKSSIVLLSKFVLS